MSPLFQIHTKIVVKEVMRLMKKDCFYYSVYPAFMEEKVPNSSIMYSDTSK